MASVEASGNIEVFPWLKSLPVAPEYHPTLAEFQDPIAYIFKIEKEASKYGICKIVPPVPPASKKNIVSNVNKSLLARSNDPTTGPVFTTRQQQVGFCPRKHNRPVQKSVWQSGENYTLVDFETKAKSFEKNYLKKCVKKVLSPLEMETLYWKATIDKPFSVEYANDMPGSGFVVRKKNSGKGNEGVATVGDTEWNMRGVSRAKGSLLRFMKEEIPGVTSPMVYVAMMFSWFAWHVEDHDLHSLNYLHLGAPKTWYGVPRDAAVAFEDVIRVHGYGGEINPLVTFATLGEKTTVISPEVLVSAGVPCCRLVQNAGEFVVTFPRAYHSGFSHGFNCGEAANIATPEWLRVAKEAAIRRASINYPPMVSHFQLLYDLALSSCTRVPESINMEPRSSRLKDKKKGEGEMLVKELFLQDVMQNNEMLHILGKGSPIILLPQNSLSSSDSQAGSSSKSSLFPSLCSPDLELKTKSSDIAKDYLATRNVHSKGFPSLASNLDSETKKASQCEQGLFSCVTCGILCFACVAVVQPSEAAARYLMSADSSVFDDWEIDGKEGSFEGISNAVSLSHSAELKLKKVADGLFDVPLCSADQIQSPEKKNIELDSISGGKVENGSSSLGLLALAYGNSSDSEEEEDTTDIRVEELQTGSSNHSDTEKNCHNVGTNLEEETSTRELLRIDSENNVPVEVSDYFGLAKNRDGSGQSFGCVNEGKTNNCTLVESNSLTHRLRYNPVTSETIATTSIMGFAQRSDDDSSRMHIFCLQHAAQVEKRLSSIGGARVFLVCHPEYPKLESQAREMAEELENNSSWTDISFRKPMEEDEEIIRLALDSENANHGNGDWAVKMGINLFYSANLSRSPLYSKQMPYNFLIYNVFGHSSLDEIPEEELNGKGSGRNKRLAVAGKWCGKVWMSSQVHPLLASKDQEEEGKMIRSPIKVEKSSAGVSTARITSLPQKTSRKRKGAVQSRPHVKAKSPEADDSDKCSDDFLISYPRQKIRNQARANWMKREISEAEDSDDSADKASADCLLSLCHKQIKSKNETKQMKKETLSEEENESEDLPLRANKGKRKLKQMKNESPEEEEEESDKSEDFPVRSNKGKHKLKQTKKETPKPENNKTKKQSGSFSEDEEDGGPSTRLRKRSVKSSNSKPKSSEPKPSSKKQDRNLPAKKLPAAKAPNASSNKSKARDEEAEYSCNIEGCTMTFNSKQELLVHKKNICPEKECGKKFFSHKYLLQHRRVHLDERPLKCPVKGCKMTFKWQWARTEHIRVHTGERPYVCTEAGCSQTFRFVSDFSRHKRKTGHKSIKKPEGKGRGLRR